jgi:hypothetical protein
MCANLASDRTESARQAHAERTRTRDRPGRRRRRAERTTDAEWPLAEVDMAARVNEGRPKNLPECPS